MDELEPWEAQNARSGFSDFYAAHTHVGWSGVPSRFRFVERRVSGLIQIKTPNLLRGNYAHMDAPRPNPNLPHCPSCGKPMLLARTVPRVASLPELRSFECRICGVVITTEDTRLS